MGLGAIWAPKSSVRTASKQLRDIKLRHNARGELKWTKVSKSRLDFYQELVDWFFEHSQLHFRCWIVPNKKALDHTKFNQGSHDDFYYKMYFSLLSKILSPAAKHAIYLDIKDTRSKFKVSKLKEVLCNDQYDFTGEMIGNIQHARSHELELMQLADFLLGGLVYHHRGLDGNYAKASIVRRIFDRSGRSLDRSSPLSDGKFNQFIWQARN